MSGGKQEWHRLPAAAQAPEKQDGDNVGRREEIEVWGLETPTAL